MDRLVLTSATLANPIDYLASERLRLIETPNLETRRTAGISVG
jgi:hypothetical protein